MESPAGVGFSVTHQKSNAFPPVSTLLHLHFAICTVAGDAPVDMIMRRLMGLFGFRVQTLATQQKIACQVLV